MQTANELGFAQIYIESMPELEKALKVYEWFGFNYLSAPLGNSGHFGCELWMIKSLKEIYGRKLGCWRLTTGFWQ